MPVLNDVKLLKQWQEHKAISEGDLSSQHEQARVAHLYAAGDEAIYRSGIQEKTAKNLVVFNKIKPFVDAVVGFMIQLRKKPQYLAKIRDSEKQQAYSMFKNAVSDYIRSNANMDQIETRQDREMLIVGYGAVDSNIIYEKNPDGEVAAEVLRFNDVFWDSQAQEPNLLDARWVYRRKAFNLDEALKRFKGSKPEDFEAYNSDESIGYTYIPGGQYNKIAPVGSSDENLIQVYYYQYWTLEKYYRMENPLFDEDIETAFANMLGELMINIKNNRSELSSKDEAEDVFEFDPLAEFLVLTPTLYADIKALFKRFEIEAESQEFLRKTYYTAIISGDTVFKKFKSPDQQGYTIKFKTGNFDPLKRTWYGMVQGMINPARYANKALSEILYVIAANSKGGVMFEKSAVEDPKRFEEQYATTKAAIMVEDGAIAGNRIQSKAQGALPTGYENVYQAADAALEQTSGITREFLGTSGNNQVSALLESQRINQVIATLAGYFDAITLYQRESARLMTTYIHILSENSEGRLIAITGEDGARQYEELSKDRLIDEYDIDISEAPNTHTQRQETAKVVIDLADKLFQAGQNIYPLVIDYIPGIREVDKIKIKQSLIPSPEQIQAQEQARAMEEEKERALQESVVNSQNAKAQKDLADSEKIQAEIDETRANTLKLIEEAKQKSTENDILQSEAIDKLTLTV